MHLDECLLLLVGDEEGVPRACHEVAQFLAFYRTRMAAGQAPPRLVALWIDAVAAGSPAELLADIPAAQHALFRIRESIGMEPIWKLCWVEAGGGSEPADHGTLRSSLISTLIERERVLARPARPRLAPVFEANEGYPSISLESARLRELAPELIGEPITWNEATNILAPLSQDRGWDRQG